MEESTKKMRFSQKPSSSPDLRFSCKPNRPSSSTDSSELAIIAAQKPDQDQNNHHHQHEDLQAREQKDQNNGRERLKRHREEVAGRVVVPERWGMEDRMKDWIDYSSFDNILVPIGVRTAREALVVEAQPRRQVSSATTSQRLMRIESRC